MPLENEASRPAALIRIVSVVVGFNGNVKAVMVEAGVASSSELVGALGWLAAQSL